MPKISFLTGLRATGSFEEKLHCFRLRLCSMRAKKDEIKKRDWRDKLEDDAAQIKDPAKRLGMRARSTWYRLIDLREERLPIYEEAKSGDPQQSQPWPRAIKAQLIFVLRKATQE
jgi:hypothetical protein